MIAAQSDKNDQKDDSAEQDISKKLPLYEVVEKYTIDELEREDLQELVELGERGDPDAG